MSPALQAAAPGRGDRRGFDQLAGQIVRETTPSILNLQAVRLARRFGLPPLVAALIAEHAFARRPQR